MRDRRSKHAQRIDKLYKADKVYPNTPAGRLKWMKNRDRSDLEGYDTPRGRVARDKVDTHALRDRKLTRRENKKNMKSVLEKNMSDFMGMW